MSNPHSFISIKKKSGKLSQQSNQNSQATYHYFGRQKKSITRGNTNNLKYQPCITSNKLPKQTSNPILELHLEVINLLQDQDKFIQIYFAKSQMENKNKYHKGRKGIKIMAHHHNKIGHRYPSSYRASLS
jgi:hypothetical protein